MLFLFKYIDDLIGKGFEWYVIAELMWYASATNISMALPLAMLLSSIMTFGALGENYELVAIKAAGISLQKAMMPLVILISLLSIGAFMFSDYMLPVANLKMGSLLWDVRNQKSTKLIQEGIFNNTITGVSIKVEKKDPDGQTLYNVLIYQNNSTNGSMAVVKAKSAKMYRSEDDKFLVMILKDGVRYEETSGDKVYNPRQRFTRFYFKETEQKFDISDMQIKRTDETLFKSNAAMLNLRQLDHYQDSTQAIADSNAHTIFMNILPSYRVFYSNYKIGKHKEIKPGNKPIYDQLTDLNRVQTVENAVTQARSVVENLSLRKEEQDNYFKMIRRYMVEYHRKFTLALSCLVLFFIGAPLGAIIRKGGLGLPVVVSIIFFLFYHIISTIGEKAAKDGQITPMMGMWIAILVLSPLGAFLTYKAAADSVLFDVDYYKQYFQKLTKFIKKKEQKPANGSS